MANATVRRGVAVAGSSAAVLALILSGCAGTTAPPAATESTATSFGHVHGLGYDPTTGRTYAATHNGVWLLPTKALPATFGDGKPNAQPTAQPQQIAGRAQDTMGFLVTGTGLLLGSGHPDPQEQPDLTPPNLGLITSNDGAETWNDVSLRADTDFHDLAAVPLPAGQTRIYGYDATRATIRISDTSGKEWVNGAAIGLRDLTADPDNPDRVLATTATGLMMSNDAAKTFAPVAEAPPLYLVDAISPSSGGGFAGVDTAGTIWRSGADGRWIAGGTTNGVPEAFVFVGGKTPWVLVSDDRGVVASDDFGVTWTILVER